MRLTAVYGAFRYTRLADSWLDLFHTQSAYVTPVFKTRANGRSVTELIANFVVDGAINQVSMFVVGDPGLLTGAVREYYEALHHVPAADV